MQRKQRFWERILQMNSQSPTWVRKKERSLGDPQVRRKWRNLREVRASVGKEVRELVVVRVGCDVYSHRTEVLPGINHFLEVTMGVGGWSESEESL